MKKVLFYLIIGVFIFLENIFVIYFFDDIGSKVESILARHYHYKNIEFLIGKLEQEDKGSRDYCDTLLAISVWFNSIAMYDNSIRYYKRVQQECNFERADTIYFLIGNVFANAGDYENARKFIQRAIEEIKDKEECKKKIYEDFLNYEFYKVPIK